MKQKKNKIPIKDFYKFRGTTKQISNINRKLFKDIDKKCSKCNSRVRVSIHHKDRNRLNNIKENLILLCNSCHSKLHLEEDRERCKKCGRMFNKGKHQCPTKKEYSKMAKGRKERERCPKCGRWFGKDKFKHKCDQARGFLGKHHTEKVKESISKKLVGRVLTEDHKRKIGIKSKERLLGKTYEELYGKEKADKIRKKISKKMVKKSPKK